jgi:alpha-beta hydrolase superfamily lysophospholipase
MSAESRASVRPTRLHVILRSSVAPWLSLNLRAVLPARTSRRAVLVLHGATLSGFLFDIPAAGRSFQERLAARGWASYALDARGFGGSTRPAPGQPGCPDDRPFGAAAAVIDDIADAVRYLRDVRGHAEVMLIGFSWGALCAGRFAARDGAAIDKLVLNAPIHGTRNDEWLLRLSDPADATRLNPAFGAYRWTTAASLQARWDSDIAVADKTQWREPEALHAVLEGALADDPLSATRSPPAFRAPNGGFADLFEAFSGRPAFDASRIRVPTLLLRGEGDTTASDADSRQLLRALGCREKRYRIVPAGGHFQCLERSMPALLDACLQFLD